MSERDERQAPTEQQDDPGNDPVARAGGNDEGDSEETPLGGDVRTIYAEDRAPGEAEPDDQPS
jgi:hypothetical protein